MSETVVFNVKMTPRWIGHAIAVTVGGGVLALAAAVVAGVPAAMVAIPFATLGLVFGLAALTPVLSRQRRTAQIDGRELMIDGTKMPVSSGLFVPGPPPCVRLSDANGTDVLELEVSNEGEGTRVLRDLGFDVAARSYDFRAVSRAIATIPRLIALTGTVGALIVGAFGLNAMGMMSPPLIFGWAALLSLAFATIGPATHVRVGADGIALKWLHRRWFLPYSKIRTIYGTTRGISAELTDGSSFEIRLAAVAPTPKGDETRAALEHRVLEAFRAWRARDPAAASELLAIGERTLEAWLADLEKLGREDHTYRGSAWTDETLWGVVEDVSADPSARAAAARILRPRVGAPERIRAASDASAAPQVRVALESIAIGEDEEALRAFETVNRRARSA